jgi:hypothetical protein
MQDRIADGPDRSRPSTLRTLFRVKRAKQPLELCGGLRAEAIN